MKKANLAVMLVFPFVVAFLGVTAIVGNLTKADKDITDINWGYDEATGFKIGMRAPLKASQVFDENAGLAYGNNLVWEVKNADDDPVPHAEIIEVSNGSGRASDFYLIGRTAGEAILTVANQKRTVSKSTTIVIYNNFALLISPVIPESHMNIDPTIYYGEYDIDAEGNKTKAKIEYTVSTLPESSNAEFSVVSSSTNLSFDLNSGVISAGNILQKTEKASITIGCTLEGEHQERTVEFSFVKDGVNVYDYDQLLQCTNKSEEGEIVVLRKNLESLWNYAKFDASGYPLIENGQLVPAKKQTELFGHVMGQKDDYALWAFDQEVYRHATTGDTTYINQWNEFAKDKAAYQESLLNDEVLAGLRVQKDFYGNGYTLNMHNLTYPYSQTQVNVGDVADYVPTLTSENLFRGPLLTYCLGDPVKFRIVALYGEDNAGIYLDGDNITINDVNVKNCDFGSHLSDMDKVGSVVDVHGNGNTIKNSVLSNGKNVVRCFSTLDFELNNCLLQNSYNFLLNVGTDETLPIDGSRSAMFVPSRGGALSSYKIDEYLAGVGDVISNTYVAKDIGALNSMIETSSLGWNTIKNGMYAIGDALSQYDLLEASEPRTTVSVEDVLFYNSGVAGIGSEAAFNGPFLYAQSPSLIQKIFGLLSSVQIDGSAIVPYLPEGLAFDSYPSKVTLKGETDFFDYKRLDTINLNGLLYQELNSVIARVMSVMGDAVAQYIPSGFDLSNIDLDAVFPLKDVWSELVSSRHLGFVPEGSEYEYVNMPFFYFGGGPNLTEIDKTDWGGASGKYREYPSELLEYFASPSTENSQRYWKLMWRLVESFIGYEPFKFGFMDGSGYNYGQAPSRDTLKANASEVTL